MTLANHLIELNKKKDALGEAIEKLQRSPGSNYLEITQLKKQKLRLKEEMARLSGGNRLTKVTLPERTLEDLEDNPEPEASMVTAEKTGDESIDLAT